MAGVYEAFRATRWGHRGAIYAAQLRHELSMVRLKAVINLLRCEHLLLNLGYARLESLPKARTFLFVANVVRHGIDALGGVRGFSGGSERSAF